MNSDRGEHTRGLFGPHQIPNLLTALRILAVGPIIGFLHQADYATALIITVVAGLTDGLDGYLARRFHWRSRFGGLLDPLADKFLQLSCYIMLTLQGFLPIWLLVLVLARDLVIVAGGVAYQVFVGRVMSDPTVVSKLNTLLQSALIIWILVDLSGFALPDRGLTALMVLVALTTAISGLQYVFIWGRRALHERAGAGTTIDG